MKMSPPHKVPGDSATATIHIQTISRPSAIFQGNVEVKSSTVEFLLLVKN